MIVGASLVWYFVSPYEFLPSLMKGTLAPTVWAFWISLSVILFLDYGFLRHTWCATACPYAKLQGALFDSSTMVIAFDRSRQDECMNCSACVRACPVNVDIRKGLSSACINCAECIDACSEKFRNKQRPGLIGYFFGQAGEPRRLVRINTILTGSAAALSFIFFIWLALTRNPYDLTILPNHLTAPGISEAGELMSPYMLAVENKSGEDAVFSVRAELNNKRLKVLPERITLKAAEYRRLPIVIMSGQNESGNAVVSLLAEGHADRWITGTAAIASPKGVR
jgi:polyferredoxin